MYIALISLLLGAFTIFEKSLHLRNSKGPPPNMFLLNRYGQV